MTTKKPLRRKDLHTIKLGMGRRGGESLVERLIDSYEGAMTQLGDASHAMHCAEPFISSTLLYDEHKLARRKIEATLAAYNNYPVEDST